MLFSHPRLPFRSSFLSHPWHLYPHSSSLLTVRFGYFFRCSSNSFVHYSVQFCDSTHPSQHPHFRHIQPLLLCFLHSPCLGPARHSWSYGVLLISHAQYFLGMHQSAYNEVYYMLKSKVELLKLVELFFPTWPLSLTLLFVKFRNDTLQEGQMEESDDDDSELDEDFGVGK